ncbi:Para-aminobenzoate synthase glutamine amidotransferase component II [Hartmannibacter diazotrophicus]|uniref:Para-aminobenzoate synthase glutamine amidotransferase component II n=1 Tax=Hartmannibacter diazotrophicus TaxID=1482074 RepID=A0A2C9D6G4_9HYPH|nr:aminodeoxychorismate/anthranilate synthase component II [Hartmannibacter diazotrophicus]SON55897.1 Para-aminobenzoate synthase glutamine amidotransferase component II [Hartmannibacter diazotrophicus]
MILIIDNYDSFVSNVARYFRELGEDTKVIRNDQITVGEVAALDPRAVVLSPGPCTPHEAGISLDLIRELSGQMPILGICLGHQCIGEAFGASVVRARQPMHGRASMVTHDDDGLFDGLPNPLKVGRYHSLIVEDVSPKGPLKVTAHAENGEIMALAHRVHPTYGVQFHPESILTESGHAMLANFLSATAEKTRG